ncbi:MAG: MFS transporter [Candidatus Pacebacteria bacterium]|nr:MFS transporter [Candidatus Paceibacterota bacterium]
MKRDRIIIYFAGFLASIPIALMSYINSSFLSPFIGERFVGLVYTLGSLVSILMLLFAPRVFRKIGGHRFLLLVIGLNTLSILWLALSTNAFSAVCSFVLGFALNIVVFFSLDELLKIFSKESATGRIRGIYLALSNFAWVVAQLLSGTVFGNFPLKTIYIIAFFIMILFFLLSLFGLKNIPDPKYDRLKILSYVKDFIKNKNLLRSYSIDFLLQFFYCWMIIYTPIYLYSYLGFTWKDIAIIFTIMLLPFVLIESSMGRYSDKVGERKMLMVGFFIISISTISLFFIQKPEIWIWAALLFLTRVGAATVEVMSDSYFFKHIKPENEEFVGIYRSTSPLAYITGPIVALMVFIFLPKFNFIFPVLGLMMLFGVYLASTIRKADI